LNNQLLDYLTNFLIDSLLAACLSRALSWGCQPVLSESKG
jgi:hypothetical protein